MAVVGSPSTNTGTDGAGCNQFSEMEGMDAAEGSGNGNDLPEQAVVGSPSTNTGCNQFIEMGGVDAAEGLRAMGLEDGPVEPNGKRAQDEQGGSTVKLRRYSRRSMS